MNAVWNYFTTNQSQIWHWTWTTTWLAGVPLVIGVLVSLPIGWLAARTGFLYPPVVAATGLLYTIPSLALFLTLPAFLNTSIISPINVAVALCVYTIALMARVVADGLRSVSTETLAAAAAMGFTGRQRLWGVQLPISVPVIGAGLRVAAVSNVSLVSVASLIGVPQLGSLFVDGNINSTNVPVIIGLVFVIGLALAFDGVILLGVRMLTPWQRAVAAR